MMRRHTRFDASLMPSGKCGEPPGSGSARLTRDARVSPRRSLSLVGVGAGPRLPTQTLRRPAGEVLPALDRHLGVAGVELDRVAAPTELLGGDDRGAGSDERVVDVTRVVADRDLAEDDRLLGRVVVLLLRAPAHDHLGRRRSPDRALVSAADIQVRDDRLADHPAGLVGPVIPGAAHREEPLVPDDLGDDLEADPDQALRDGARVDAGMPDVADLEGWHEGERLAPVAARVAR